MITEELIKWGIEHKMESFITRNRENVLKLVNEREKSVLDKYFKSKYIIPESIKNKLNNS